MTVPGSGCCALPGAAPVSQALSLLYPRGHFLENALGRSKAGPGPAAGRNSSQGWLPAAAEKVTVPPTPVRRIPAAEGSQAQGDPHSALPLWGLGLAQQGQPPWEWCSLSPTKRDRRCPWLSPRPAQSWDLGQPGLQGVFNRSLRLPECCSHLECCRMQVQLGLRRGTFESFQSQKRAQAKGTWG